MKVRIDASARTFVVVCGCGWRDLALSRAGAWTQARAHELRAHPTETDTSLNAWRHAERTRREP